MAIRTAIDSSAVENMLMENRSEELLEKAKFYKEKGVFEDMLAFRYSLGRCNLFHVLVKHSNKKTIRTMFNYVIEVMGRKYFLNEANKTLDRNSRNVLIIAAKHKNMDIVLSLLNEYELDPNHYCRYNKTSALSYLLKRKKFDVAVQLLHKMDSTEYSPEMKEWFQQDLSQLRTCLSDPELTSHDWLTALTMKHTGRGRITKIEQPIFVEKSSFEGARMRQIMRHVSVQLFQHWMEISESEILDDVQVMCVERSPNRQNPNPKPCLFIACTPLYIGEIVLNDFKMKTWREMLTTSYEAEDETSQERVDRANLKICNRVWGKENDKSTKASKKIGEVLKNEVKRTQKVIKIRGGSVKLPYFEYQEKTVYLLTTDGYSMKGLHAEEVLCDVADHLKSNYAVKCSIFGKSRACISCTGRMVSSNIDQYNKHNGFVWLSSVEQQKQTHALKTLDLLFTVPSYVTKVGETLTPQYDTASDSE